MNALLIPLAAFGVAVIAQFVSYRLTRGKVGLLASLFAALISGSIFLCVLLLLGTLGIKETLEAGIFFLCLWYCFFHFINIGEASLRIRILSEIDERGGRLPKTEVDSLYNPKSIVTSRIERLTKSGDLLFRGGVFSLGKPRLILVARVITLLKVLLHGSTKTSRFVVLGGSGLVGQHLTRHLKASGHDVLSLGSRDFDLTDPSNLSKLAALLRPGDAIVVLAMIRGKDDQAYEMNVAMGKVLAEAIGNASVSYLLYVSSDAVYGDEKSPLSETTPASAQDGYALAHLQREKLISLSCERKKIPYAILRPCAIYGTGDRLASYGINKFVQSARDEGVIRLFGNGEESREHVSASDLVKIIEIFVSRKIVGLFNVAPGRAITFRQAAELVQQAFSTSVSIVTEPRKQNPFDRAHDVARLRASLPDFDFTDMSDELKKMVRP